MLMSKEMKRVVRDNGYGVLAWAITKLIENGQHNVAAMIICCLCLLPRDKEVENNGVIAVLTNFKLRKAAESADTHFWQLPHHHPRCRDLLEADGSVLYSRGWTQICRERIFRVSNSSRHSFVHFWSAIRRTPGHRCSRIRQVVRLLLE